MKPIDTAEHYHEDLHSHRRPRRAKWAQPDIAERSVALFNGLRIVAYLPTLAAIQASGQADQHSLFTWLTFLGANLTMALWLHEQNGRHINRAVAVNAFNAFMCGAIAASIVWLRWLQPSAAFPTLF